VKGKERKRKREIKEKKRKDGGKKGNKEERYTVLTSFQLTKCVK
jgi:hypothetical protein